VIVVGCCLTASAHQSFGDAIAVTGAYIAVTSPLAHDDPLQRAVGGVYIYKRTSVILGFLLRVS